MALPLLMLATAAMLTVLLLVALCWAGQRVWRAAMHAIERRRRRRTQFYLRRVGLMPEAWRAPKLIPLATAGRSPHRRTPRASW